MTMITIDDDKCNDDHYYNSLTLYHGLAKVYTNIGLMSLDLLALPLCNTR